MAANNKIRLLRFYQLLKKYTDDEHPMSTDEIVEKMQEDYDISTNRNLISDDIKAFNEAEINCETQPEGRSHQNGYFYDNFPLDLAELRILVDAVASAKFITEKQSRELIDKIKSVTSVHKAKQLISHVQVEGRSKTKNTSGYYILNKINEAFETNCKISFQYTDFSVFGERILKHNGEEYIVSPYALIWDGDYYYLIGYCDNRQHTRNFRLDRIYKEPVILEERALPVPEDFDLGKYTRTVFRMYDTEEETEVELECDYGIMKAIIDQFGNNYKLTGVEGDLFKVKALVCPSPNFYRWVFGWNGAMKIIGPENVKNEYRKMLRKALEEDYENSNQTI